MKRGKLHLFRLWGLLLLLAACGDDDSYHYPSVKLEFVTVEADGDGHIQTLISDGGALLPVVEDLTKTAITPNTTRRVMSNYETLPHGARIYSMQTLVTPEPKPENDPAYEDGIKTDPIDELVSIWRGGDCLNMILNLKVGTGQGHVFGIVEDTSQLETEGIVRLLLYHDANNDAQVYNRRAYISVPLSKYTAPNRTIKIQFKYCTYNEDGSVVVSDKSI